MSPLVDAVGYSRSVRVGGHIAVSGTAPVVRDGSEPPADAYGQARRCLEIIVEALSELGARPEHVVRTRIFHTRAEDIEEIGQAHREVFGAVLPATSGVVVAALHDPNWLVEIEADAIVS